MRLCIDIEWRNDQPKRVFPCLPYSFCIRAGDPEGIQVFSRGRTGMSTILNTWSSIQWASSHPADTWISPFTVYGLIMTITNGSLASGINKNVMFALSGQHIAMFALQTLTSLICAALGVGAASPEVQLGKTTLVGRDVTLLKQDFFGGKSIHKLLYQRTTYSCHCCRHPFRGTTSWESSPLAPSVEDQP